MKTIFEKISKILMLFVALFATATANAETIPSSLKMTYYNKSNLPISFPATFHVKKTTTGKFAYCSYYAKKPPVTSVSYTRGNQVSDNGMNYILKESYNAQNDNDFFVYQTALWTYMIDKGIMPSPYYDLTVFRLRVNNSNTATANRIKSLVKNAKSAGAMNTSAPTIKLDTTNAKFSYNSSNNTYVLSPIIVTSSTGNYNVKLDNVPAGTTTKKNGNQLEIIIPNKSLTQIKTQITFSVNNSKDVYTSYYYKPSNSAYQIMTVPFKVSKVANAQKTVTLAKKPSINIIKKDEDGKVLSGAILQIKNSNGIVIDTWTTTGEKHKVSNLEPGTYSLIETTAPTGFRLRATTIVFTVKQDGTIVNPDNKTLSMITVKNFKTSVKISKKDITNKQELPGATLVIKDATGKEVAKWVSTNQTHEIKGLPIGNYTLTETNAPSGYVLNKETISFRIDATGRIYDSNGNKISKVIMYNQKEEKKICKIENGVHYGKDGNKVTEQEYKDQCLKICKIENGVHYGKDGNKVTEQEYKDQCLKICKIENGVHYGKDGNKVTEQEYKDQCLKICKIENGVHYGKDGNKVTEQEYKDQCLKICKIENGVHYGKDGNKVTEQEYKDQCLKICKIENGVHYGKDGNKVTEQEYKDQCLKICKIENGVHYGKDGNKVTEQEYKDQCLKICKIENGVHYGKDGNKVTEQEYKDQCLKICKIENGVHYGKDGNKVTEQEYKDQCLKICKIENGVHYGKDGNKVTEQEYKDQCLKICKIENGVYYDSNGNKVTEQEYKAQCEKKQLTIISKEDITTGKELAGATLVVKDYNGNIIETWVSTNETHKIEGLKPGTYTLTETKAPEGYILSTESITFTVKEDGSTTTVVMTNTPDTKEEVPTPTPTPEVPSQPVAQEVVVESTASFKTIVSSLIGVIIASAGATVIALSAKSKKNK